MHKFYVRIMMCNNVLYDTGDKYLLRKIKKKMAGHSLRMALGHFCESHYQPNSFCSCVSYQRHLLNMPFLRLVSMWLSCKESTCQCRRCGFDPQVKKILWRRKWQPYPVFLPKKSHGQRNLAGCNPWGVKELDMTQQLN